MNLLEGVRVNTNYTRSINIERDSEEAELVRPYVITTRAKQTLERISIALKEENAPRAWAVIGPYGAGKSAFGLFLSRLLEASPSAGSKYARNTLKYADAQLHSVYQKYQRGGRGFCCIALTGSPEPLAQRLVCAMLPAAEAFFGGRKGRPPKIVDELKMAITSETFSVSKVVALMAKLQESVSRADGRGVLVVIDELGKFLEYEARHRGATDIFLLQALAEHSVRKATVPLVLVVLLHQAIELYAQTLGEQLKNEWKKVQGRFETIPFLESTEQTLRVMKAAISADLPKKLKSIIYKETGRIAKTLAELGALPAGLLPREAQELFASCYPLHPVSLLILPTLCQRVAQNERTLFSYLGSRESHGFVDSISRLTFNDHVEIDWIRPDEIYEYFILNQPGLMSDQGTHRRWAEVITALERLGDAPDSEVKLLKTIGLLNIISAQGGLRASDEVLDLCLRKSKQNGGPTKKVAQALIKRAVIAYRRFNNEYRVWQGSDFDLETALRDQRAEIGKVDSSEVLNELMPLPAIVARRHAIQTGTLRYFLPVFVNASNVTRIIRTESPIIFICLAETPEEINIFRERLSGIGMWHTPAVICGGGVPIKEAVMDVLALQRVQRQSAELANDPVAQRELKDRLFIAVRTERELINAIFEEPEQCDWVIGDSKKPVRNKRELQVRLSNLLDQVYSKAPILRNELINRERPSATAIAARKKLLVAMLDHPTVEDLGIDKFPAEKAMYRAVLRATGLHAHADGKWLFQQPWAGHNDPLRLQPMWDVVMELLGPKAPAAPTLASIYKVLSQPPYGIKAGILPILILAIYHSLRQDIALSEKGQFVPFLTKEILESLLKDPESFALQYFHVGASRNKIFEQYVKAITGEMPEEANLISVLQPLAKLMVGLPDYTKQTKRLSAEAIAVRDLFFASKAPAELVFNELPKALGLELEIDQSEPEYLEAFTEKFKSILAELRVAYHALLHDLVEMLRLAFVLGPKLELHDVRMSLQGRCGGLEAYTIDPQCTAFLGRLIDPYGDETQWLVSLANFLARKPPEKWIDDDLDAAKYRLTELASRVRDLWRLQLHYEDARSVKHGDLEASLIRIISTRDGERQALVTLDELGRALVLDRTVEIKKVLDFLPNDELRLATLAEAVKNIILADENKSDKDDESAKISDKKGVA